LLRILRIIIIICYFRYNYWLILLGTCTHRCGDGIQVLQEECDDGNNIPFDGCSPTCEMEPGYFCESHDNNTFLPYCNKCVTDWVNTTQSHPLDNWVRLTRNFIHF
jgi:cysteine-rich repeat protein